MKRIRNRERFARNQLRAQKRAARPHRISTKGMFGKKAPLLVRSVSAAGQIVAPPNFSLIGNPEGVIDFFAALESAARKEERIFIDLKKVEHLTIEALLLILSRMKAKAHWKCRGIGGSEPKDEKARAAFIHSGFYSHVSHKLKNHRTEDDHGILSKHVGKKVREDLCDKLVRYATKSLYGEERKNGGLYRTLIECMANTRDHAHGNRSGSECWWVAADYDAEKGIVYFAFVDTGVGIFNSVKMQGFLRLVGKFFGIVTYPDLLKDLLNAQLGSRTNLPYRGKGFPAIKRAHDRGQLKNLKLITNTAYLDVTTGTGKVLNDGREFSGTCLTWELHRE